MKSQLGGENKEDSAGREERDDEEGKEDNFAPYFTTVLEEEKEEEELGEHFCHEKRRIREIQTARTHVVVA